MKRSILKVIVTVIVLVALPVFTLAVTEDTSRCRCWYAGYDANMAGHSFEGDGPGGSKDDCDLLGQKIEWEDGWYSAEAEESRKCPYKTR